MLEGKAEERAFEYFKSGFHCAESISKAIVELHAAGSSSEVPKVASGFGGGIGGTHEDVCGALTGGIIAIGYLLGRMEPGKDIQNAREIASEFRRRFVEAFGSSNCQAILDRLSKREDGFDCKKLTAAAAELLSESLMERGISR